MYYKIFLYRTNTSGIIQPTLTPTSDRPLELVMACANALFNQCYFFSINGIGDWGGRRSTIIDPDGRILQEVGTSQTFMTEMIDLDQTSRTREYGTLGLGQTLKQLRNSGHTFPIYGNGKLPEGSFDNLGTLAYQREINKIKTS
jgi:predicted amidohydrolase